MPSTISSLFLSWNICYVILCLLCLSDLINGTKSPVTSPEPDEASSLQHHHHRGSPLDRLHAAVRMSPVDRRAGAAAGGGAHPAILHLLQHQQQQQQLQGRAPVNMPQGKWPHRVFCYVYV